VRLYEVCRPMMPNIEPKNTLIAVALEHELPRNLLEGWNVIYTGVGKINASIAATQSIIATQPTHLINYGTAGSLNPNITGLHRVNKIVQRDMDVRPLGFNLGHTPFDNISHIDLGGEGLSLGTGDQFVTAPPELITDIVDMEAYALAKVASQFRTKFYCWKYISDNADKNASDHWAENVDKGASAFANRILRPLSNNDCHL
jgi:adenosylhomocysteine nucleosidase